MTKALDILLPVTGCGLLLALIIIMVRRKLHREYRFFFFYVVFSFFSAILFSLTVSNEKTYSYIYWISDGVSVIFVLLALHEVFRDIFHGFYSFWWFRLIFPSAVVVMCLLAARRTLISPRSTQPLMSAIFYLSGAFSLIPCGIFLVFMLLVMGLRVRCRRIPYYIALGFAVSSMGDWMLYSLLSGYKYTLTARYLPPAAYMCATLIWLWSFSGKFVSQPELKWEMMPRRNSRSGPARTEIKNRLVS